MENFFHGVENEERRVRRVLRAAPCVLLVSGLRPYLNVLDAAFMEEDLNVIFLMGILSLRSS